MALRIVVSLHLRGASSPESGYFRRALSARRRAEVLGAQLAAWGPDTLAFDFGPEEVEEAVDLARATFDDLTSAEPRFSAGVAFGELERAGGAGHLGWGEPLVTAWTLSCSAEPGEVLIDERCPRHLADALRTRGERRLAGSLTALVLDARHPFARDTLVDDLGGGGKVRVTVPPLPPLPAFSRSSRPAVDDAAPSTQRHPSEPPPTIRSDPPEDIEPPAPSEVLPAAPLPLPTLPAPTLPAALLPPHAPPVGRAPPPVVAVPPPSVGTDERATEPGPPALGFDPVASDGEPSEPSEPSEPEPSGEREANIPPRPPSVVPPPRLPSARTAPSVPPPGSSARGVPPSAPPLAASRISWPGGSDEYGELAAAARQALLKGNVTELERLSDELKNRGEADLADRMAGFVAWNRGAKAEALRKLRVAADMEIRPAHRVRALLAYGVALAASGRTDAALLAALGALAHAREVSDRQGEHVCARFLARLSAAAGYERAASTWAEVADEIPLSRSEERTRSA